MTIDIARRVRVPVPDAFIERVVAVSARAGDAERRPLPDARSGTGGYPSPQGRKGDGVPRGQTAGVARTSRTRERVSVSVAFVGAQAIRALNRTYHGEDRVTDVLAFGQVSGVRHQRSADIGEIVVCPSHVKRNAARAGEPFRRELARVLVHGTLHLIGYDHATPRDAERMFAVQEQIVKILKSKP